MNDSKDTPDSKGVKSKKTNDDNRIQPLRLESSNLRGRYVKLGSVLDDVLDPHGYPAPVAHLVAEMMTLTLLLSSMIKYKGIFTLQVKGDGPISMMVADMTLPDCIVRACATFDDERLEHAREQLSALKTVEGSQNHLAQYLGQGYIAFTVDPEGAEDRYQGIVELKGSSLVDCVQHYFQQSEQIDTGIKMAAGIRNGKWRAGGIMLQTMPEEEINTRSGLSNLDEDAWRRAMILMDTCTEDESLDSNLTIHELLTRLFHEEGVRVFDPMNVKKGCRCSQERVQTMVSMMDKDDIAYMTKKGVIEMTCEFCSTKYKMNKKDIELNDKTKK